MPPHRWTIGGTRRRSVGVGITTQVRVALHLTEPGPTGCASRHLFVGVLKRSTSPQTLQHSRSSICLVTAMPAPPKVWHHVEIVLIPGRARYPSSKYRCLTDAIG
ncbi:hypothetical protein H112_06016 [Trichophyton rubrum D6]|uniref:Uncharacterized protein n=3 Tax=Trichophyton TaxID=5550 RepID=F2SLP4_TRIRC|nr:uncharacterized protein TERG_03722 [Trichophyton rubrum CBS 118892]EZF14847.1 hypothetical protein H100_06030 [Trichophyton rubrum MR850]EZF39964.1 hypothetical protein H102_05999 [Trichophyton rubrum CBS 100081]EZF50604.1 hypothetical protein H103_06024 [Trichophyton rubrum CBS 288.86]EZF61148.1 hypothetical protein H104_06012 [Trichophyton rubrum CBS 289.86]EZF71781.1 hypothetical protein H105_06039 [Trichophyton soudanense CBS 452.61]EZF82364.1 hypothetical protein H110_06020 [Trichophy